jgi:hypothetical protein
MSSHTALEYFSQPLSEVVYQPLPSQPFCLFCDEAKLNRLLCEREMVSSTKNKMKGVRMPHMSMIGEEEFMVRYFLPVIILNEINHISKINNFFFRIIMH